MRRVSVLVLFLGAVVSLSSAQTYPSNAGQNWTHVPAGFPPYTNVTVYINSVDYPSGAAMNSAIRNGANAVSTGFNNTNSFSFVDTAGPPVPTGYWLYVQAGTPPDGLWELNSYTVQAPAPGASTADVLNSTITMLSTFTDPGSFQTWFAHSLSHSFFLGDCPGCDPDSTIMSTGVLPWDVAGLPGPSLQDWMNESWYAGGGGGDGGGGCGGDICPLQY